MKRVLILALSVSLLFIGGSAFAANSGASLDFSGSVASEPTGGFGTGWGLDVGANVDFARLGIKVNLPEKMKMQARASAGYYKWTDDVFGVDLEYRRIPFDVGGRFVYTINPQAHAYGDLGVEVSFDRREFFGSSETDTNLGLVPGVGINYYLNDRVYIGAEVRAHLIKDAYSTFGANVGFDLP